MSPVAKEHRRISKDQPGEAGRIKPRGGVTAEPERAVTLERPLFLHLRFPFPNAKGGGN